MLYAIPTDTCYGIGCPISDAIWYASIYSLKWRDTSKPLAIVVSTYDDIPDYIHITPQQVEYLRMYSRPFSILWKRKYILPEYIDASMYPNLSIRVAAVCTTSSIYSEILGHHILPMYLTSANISGQSECMYATDVAKTFSEIYTAGGMYILGTVSAMQPPSDIFSFVGDTLDIEYIRQVNIR